MRTVFKSFQFFEKKNIMKRQLGPENIKASTSLNIHAIQKRKSTKIPGKGSALRKVVIVWHQMGASTIFKVSNAD